MTQRCSATSAATAASKAPNERFPSLDAALDFPLYFILEETIKGVLALAELRARYERFKTEYADHGEAGQYFVTFVDNHDQMSRPYRRFYARQSISRASRAGDRLSAYKPRGALYLLWHRARFRRRR